MKYNYTIRAACVLAIVVALASCGGEDESAPADTEEADAGTTASIVASSSELVAAAGADGTWIIATTEDLSIDEPVTVAGEFTNRGDVDRKIALYTQDADRNITDRFTLEVPRLTVQSPSTRIEHGTVVGDVYVEAENFRLNDVTVEGNLYFASDVYRESAQIEDNSEVTGEIAVQ